MYVCMSCYLLKRVWVLPRCGLQTLHTLGVAVLLGEQSGCLARVFSIFLSHFTFLYEKGKFRNTETGLCNPDMRGKGRGGNKSLFMFLRFGSERNKGMLVRLKQNKTENRPHSSWS